MSFTGLPAGPTPRKARWAIPRCMSRIAPGKLRSSSKAKALSARTSFGAELSTPPPVLVESMPAVAVPVLAIPVSHPFGRCRSSEANPRCRLPSFYHFVTFVTRADVLLRSRWSRGRPRRDQGGLARQSVGRRLARSRPMGSRAYPRPDAQWGGRSDRQLAGTADRYTGAPATASLATGSRSMDPASDQTDGAAAATLTLPGRSRIGGARRHRPHAAHSQAVVEPFPPGRIDQEGHGTRRSPLVCPLPMSLPSSRKASRVASAMIVNWGLTPSELGAAEPSAT